jgi:hypothetical protein
MSGYRTSKCTLKKKEEEEEEKNTATGRKDDDNDDDVVKDSVQNEIFGWNDTESSSFAVAAATTSSPINICRHNMTYTILPEEYSIIEDIPNSWNPDEAFIEVCGNRICKN